MIICEYMSFRLFKKKISKICNRFPENDKKVYVVPCTAFSVSFSFALTERYQSTIKAWNDGRQWSWLINGVMRLEKQSIFEKKQIKGFGKMQLLGGIDHIP